MLVERHAVLRTSYHDTPDGPVQRIHPPAGELLATWPGSSAVDDRSPAGAWLRRSATRPFVLRTPPLIRAALVSEGPLLHHLVLTVHHIACDAASWQIIDTELWSVYGALIKGDADPRTPLTVQYADYARSQLAAAQAGDLVRDRAYWSEQLAGAPYTELPPDRPRTAHDEPAGDEMFAHLPLELVERLGALARTERASFFAVLQAMLSLALHLHTGETDVVTGTVSAGRTQPAFSPLVGFFVNPLVLRVPVTGSMTLRAVLAESRDALLDALDHQEVPFDQIVEDLRPQRTPGRNPLFQVTIQVLYEDRPARPPDGVQAEPVGWVGSGNTWFDVALVARRHPGGCELGLTFATALFDRSRMHDFLGDLVDLLEQIAAWPDRQVAQVALRSGREAAALIHAAHSHGPPRFVNALDLVRAQATAAPDAPAVSCEGRTVSYGTVLSRAEAFAAQLRAAGAVPGDRIGLLLPSSEHFVTAMLGVLLSGAAYVPFSPDHPPARLAALARVAGVRIAVAQDADQARVLAADTVLLIDDAATEPDDGAVPVGAPADRPVGPEDLAYTLFTSGSTGAPKGVDITHRNVGAQVTNAVQMYGLTRGTRVLQVAAATFDPSVTEILGPLAAGAVVHLMPDHVRRSPELVSAVLRDEAIEVAAFTPAVLALLDPGPYPALRVLAAGGEVLSANVLNAWNHVPERFLNLYGPTETTVVSLSHECEPRHYVTAPPIGTAWPGEYAVVLDRYSRPAPVGLPGELVIGGVGVARGYHGDRRLTAAKFVESPFGAAGERMYRTGDICVRSSDGLIHFVGRRDDQVKIRGQRISLLEVERTLSALDGVTGAAVVTSGDTATDRVLVAFVTVAGRFDETSLRKATAELLPSAMVPTRFLRLPRLPATPNGKVDRWALAETADLRGSPGTTGGAEPVGAPPPKGAALATGGTAVGAVARLVRERLRLDEVPTDVSFFDLGGNSLQLAALCAEIRDRLGAAVTARDLLQHQTVARIGALVEARTADPGAAGVAAGDEVDGWAELAPGPGETPTVLVHDGSGSLFAYVDLKRAFGRRRPVYGLDGAHLSYPPGAAAPTVQALAAMHAATMDRNLGDRAVVLAGWSFGGLVALELYRRRIATGHRDQQLVMIDTWFPRPLVGTAPVEQHYFEHLRGSGHLPAASAWPGGGGGTPLERLLSALETVGAPPDRFPPSAVADRFFRFAAFAESRASFRPGRLTGDVLMCGAGPESMEAWRAGAAPEIRFENVGGDHFSVVRGARAGLIADLVPAPIPEART